MAVGWLCVGYGLAIYGLTIGQLWVGYGLAISYPSAGYEAGYEAEYRLAIG